MIDKIGVLQGKPRGNVGRKAMYLTPLWAGRQVALLRAV